MKTRDLLRTLHAADPSADVNECWHLSLAGGSLFLGSFQTQTQILKFFSKVSLKVLSGS